MNPQSIIFITFTLQTCWSFLHLRFEPTHHIPLLAPLDSIGEPLILTPLLESENFSKARQRSSVPPLLKDIISNSGYFTVDKKYNSNLFFWFFKAKDSDWKKAPLILWLQGGPGCSSLLGLFTEHGPFYVVKGKLRRRKYAWTNQYNMLYIDQPVGTGFSFTNSSKGYVNNHEKVADHLYIALTQFFLLYPELKKNKFYISGESYAGKFVPAIAYKIHKLKKAGKCDFNLKGLFMVSAYSDPINMLQFSDFIYKIGLVDLQTKNNMKILENAAVSYIHSKSYLMAAIKENEIKEEMLKNSTFSIYDYTRENFSLNWKYLEYVQSADVRKKIHVGNTPHYLLSMDVNQQFVEDYMQSVRLWIEELLEHYQIAFVGGQLDISAAYFLVSRVLQKLRWSGAFQFSQAKRKFLYDGQKVTGYYKVAGNLKDIFIRKAGHMVPEDQPKATLSALQKYIDGAFKIKKLFA